MRVAVCFILLWLLGGCSSPALDACALLDNEAVEKAMGSRMKRQESDVSINNGRLSSSACYMDFENGLHAKVVTEEYSDEAYRDNMRNGIGVFRQRTEDKDMTEALGYPAFASGKHEFLEADVTEDRFLYIHLRDDGSQRVARQDSGPGWAIAKFERDAVPNARDKLIAIAQAIDF